MRQVLLTSLQSGYLGGTRVYLYGPDSTGAISYSQYIPTTTNRIGQEETGWLETNWLTTPWLGTKRYAGWLRSPWLSQNWLQEVEPLQLFSFEHEYGTFQYGATVEQNGIVPSTVNTSNIFINDPPRQPTTATITFDTTYKTASITIDKDLQAMDQVIQNPPVLYIVSGTESGSVISGETIYAEGTGTSVGTNAYTTTASNGTWSLSLPTGWSGTVEASASTSTSNTTTITNISSNTVFNTSNSSSGATQRTISGTITDYSTGFGIGSINILARGTGASNGMNILTSTNSSGVYSFAVPDGWIGETIPRASNYFFINRTRSYSAVTSNQSLQDFSGVFLNQ